MAAIEFVVVEVVVVVEAVDLVVPDQIVVRHYPCVYKFYYFYWPLQHLYIQLLLRNDY